MTVAELALLPVSLTHNFFCSILHIHLHQKLIVRTLDPEGEYHYVVWVCMHCGRDVEPV